MKDKLINKRYWRFKVGLSPSKTICFICFNKNILKMMKIFFYFILKTLFVLKIFKFLSWLFGSLLNCVLGVLACSRAWRVCVLTCLACLRVWRACVLGVLAGVRACYDEMFYFLTCLHTWCAFLSYLLYISILKFKNSYSEEFVCFVKLKIFLIYILIPTYETVLNKFKGSRKVNRYII